jgi:adenylate kinase
LSQQVDQKIQLKREEIEMLGVHSMPVRNYLMKHILPSITDALVEIVKMKPNDPIDYLVS